MMSQYKILLKKIEMQITKIQIYIKEKENTIMLILKQIFQKKKKN